MLITELITDLEAKIAECDKWRAYYSNNLSLNHTFNLYDENDSVVDSISYNGNGGGAAMWADWRSANPSLDGTNGTDAENAFYEHYDDFINERFFIDSGGDDSLVKSRSQMQAHYTSLKEPIVADLEHVQSLQAAGITDTDDAVVPVDYVSESGHSRTPE